MSGTGAHLPTEHTTQRHTQTLTRYMHSVLSEQLDVTVLAASSAKPQKHTKLSIVCFMTILSVCPSVCHTCDLSKLIELIWNVGFLGLPYIVIRGSVIPQKAISISRVIQTLNVAILSVHCHSAGVQFSASCS